jgi:outer membrane protein
MRIYLTLLCITAFAFKGVSQEKTVWSLQDCIAFAITNNITIKQSESDRDIAEVNYTQSRYSRFPSLSASATQNMNNGTSIDPITSSFVTQMVHSTSLATTAQVTLYNGNYINNTIKQNDLLVKQNEFYISEAKNNVTLSVTEAYLMALYYKEGIAVAEQAVSSSQSQLDQVRKKYNAGSVAGIDVADLETQLSSDNYNLVTARNSYRQQIITLKQLLEMDPTVPFEIAEPELPEPVALIPEVGQIYNTAIANMPEIKSAALQTDIKTVELDKSKSGYLPTVSLYAGLNTGYTNTQNFNFATQMDNNFYQNAGLSVNIPIFSNYKNKASVEKAKISIEQSKYTAQSEAKQLYLKVESVWQNAVSAQSGMEAALALRNSSRQAYEMAGKKAALGTLNPTELLVSQNTYLSAEQKYLQTKFSAALYYQLLQFYQGNEIKL